ASLNLNITYSPIKIVEFIFVVICATLIYTSIKLATASIAFWVKFSQSYMFMAYQISTFAKYPIGIYPSAIKFILTFLIPFAFTGYYPGAYFIGKGSILSGVLLPFLVSLISITVSYKIWLKGISV
ncbi:multidrug ABC transporter permease, partial [Clostridium perfringens]|uniref:ABC-2 family transporter protein n=1 Tax=Clostridium perfringens TaxID=1502 RepID=UPI002AC5F516